MINKIPKEVWYNEQPGLGEFVNENLKYFPLTEQIAHDDIGIVVFHSQNGKSVYPAGIISLTETEHNGKKSDYFIFQYHPEYVDDPNLPVLSPRLPKQKEPYYYDCSEKKSLPPFFDNLVSSAGSWLGYVQSRTLGLLQKNRKYTEEQTYDMADNIFARYLRLLHFSRGISGAFAMTSIMPESLSVSQGDNFNEWASLQQTTMVGMQPKIAGSLGEDGLMRPSELQQHSTHILKFVKGVSDKNCILKNEYMCNKALEALHKGGPVEINDVFLTKLHFGDSEEVVLAIKRFDRLENGGRRHFLEGIQIMDLPDKDLYTQSYAHVARDVLKYDPTLCAEFFERIVGQFIIGNTDLHLKNFGFFTDSKGGLTFTPSYDHVEGIFINKKDTNVALRFDFNLKENPVSLREIDQKKIRNLAKNLKVDETTRDEILGRLKLNCEKLCETIINLPIPLHPTNEKYNPNSNQFDRGEADMMGTHAYMSQSKEIFITDTQRKEFVDRVRARVKSMLNYQIETLCPDPSLGISNAQNLGSDRKNVDGRIAGY